MINYIIYLVNIKNFGLVYMFYIRVDECLFFLNVVLYEFLLCICLKLIYVDLMYFLIFLVYILNVLIYSIKEIKCYNV